MARACEPEEAVESHMRREVQRKLKGRFYKLIPGLSKGIPDRMVLLPGGRIFLVELKAEDGEVEPIQKVWHGQAAELGTEVVVLVGRADVDRWIASQLKPRPKMPDSVVIDWTAETVTIDGRPFPWFIAEEGPEFDGALDFGPDTVLRMMVPILTLASRVTVTGERKL